MTALTGTEQPLYERLTVTLAPDAAAAMGKLQARTGYKKNDIVNRGLLVYELVDSLIRNGTSIYSIDADGNAERIHII